MSLFIVYFHGYGSSPKTDKVSILRERLNVPVFCFPADIDPVKAKKMIEYNIDQVLLENKYRNSKMVFVGTSLGGWMASEMAKKYNVPAIVINPSCNPGVSLEKYGISEEIRKHYSIIEFSKNNTYFFAENDEVIDNKEIIKELQLLCYEVYIDKKADHRYNGEAFEQVIKYIEKNYLKKF